MRMSTHVIPVEAVDVAVYVIQTDDPESDGTFEWTSTTLVVATAFAGGAQGLGYSYAHRAAADVVAETLAPVVRGQDALLGPVPAQLDGETRLRELSLQRLRT